MDDAEQSRHGAVGTGGGDGARDFASRVMRVSALAEPVRRRLYQYVVAQAEPVSRDQAAEATGVARHTAKFHLDRLVAEGLLEARSRRLTGRTGPGAGRPAKLYLRATGEVAVSVPQRRYDLASRIMADAIARSAAGGGPVEDVLRDVSAEHGRRLARSAPGPHPHPVAATCDLLAELGYQPRDSGAEVVLTGCPFHALVAEHPALVCGMNLSLLAALTEEVGPGAPTPRLEPAPGRCCVVLSHRSPG